MDPTPSPSRPAPVPEPGILPVDLPWYRLPFFWGLIALVAPPLGLWLLWRNPEVTRRRKAVRTVLLGLYLPAWTVAAIWVLVLMGFLEVEWKGGFGPSLVRRKTAPDYRAVESSRAGQPSASRPEPTAAARAGAYWTDLRGPRRDGHYTEQPIVTNWPARGPRLVWSQPIGGGYASFVVAEGRAFTIEQRRELEAVIAYQLDNGREAWVYTYPAEFTEWMGGDGPRATPTYHGGLVYSLGATGHLVCLSAANGKPLWEKDVLADNGRVNLHYGMAASPLVYEEKLIVSTGEGAPGRAVVAYHRLTADRIWSALDDKAAYVSPVLATLAGRRQVVTVTASRVVSLDPEDGRLLWEHPWTVQYDNAICMPVTVAPNRVFISAGYGAGCVLLEVTEAGGTWSARPVWRNRNMKNKFNASVFWEGHLYGLDEGVLCCVDAETGERKWRDGRYGYGQLLLARGHLVIVGGDGDLALVRADPAGFAEVHRSPALRGKTWNVPAFAQGRLLVRNSATMACYDLRVPEL